MIGLKEIALIAFILFLLFNKEIISYFSTKDPRILRGITEKMNISESKEIPKVIYKTGIDDYNNINDDVIDVFENTLKLNPDFKIYYYSDKDSRDLIKNNFNDDTLDAYDTLIPGAYKADLFRYCIMYLNGGIYSDLTQRFTTPFKDFINFKKDNLFLVEDRPQLDYRKKGPTTETKPGIQISFMAARPGNPVYLHAIRKIIENVKNKDYGYNPLDPTGPRLFYNVLVNHGKDYRIGLKETGKRIIDNEGKTIIINKLNGHHKVILKNKPHYSDLWFRRKIYK